MVNAVSFCSPGINCTLGGKLVIQLLGTPEREIEKWSTLGL
jgi:hypothetical protein